MLPLVAVLRSSVLENEGKASHIWYFSDFEISRGPSIYVFVIQKNYKEYRKSNKISPVLVLHLLQIWRGIILGVGDALVRLQNF